jgi:hypothetical protein
MRRGYYEECNSLARFVNTLWMEWLGKQKADGVAEYLQQLFRPFKVES